MVFLKTIEEDCPVFHNCVRFLVTSTLTAVVLFTGSGAYYDNESKSITTTISFSVRNSTNKDKAFPKECSFFLCFCNVKVFTAYKESKIGKQNKPKILESLRSKAPLPFKSTNTLSRRAPLDISSRSVNNTPCESTVLPCIFIDKLRCPNRSWPT